MFKMPLYRSRTDLEMTGDFLVGLGLGHPIQDLLLLDGEKRRILVARTLSLYHWLNILPPRLFLQLFDLPIHEVMGQRSQGNIKGVKLTVNYVTGKLGHPKTHLV